VVTRLDVHLGADLPGADPVISVTWHPHALNTDAALIPASTGTMPYTYQGWTEGTLTGGDDSFADGNPATYSTLDQAVHDYQFTTMRFATTQAVPSSLPIGLHAHFEVESVVGLPAAQFDLCYGATFPASAWQGYGYYVPPNTFGFDVILTDPTDQAFWAANMADPGFFLAVVSVQQASATTIRVRELSIVLDYASTPPLRQVQRDDGLGRSVMRARSTRSVQRSIRQRGYR